MKVETLSKLCTWLLDKTFFSPTS